MTLLLPLAVLAATLPTMLLRDNNYDDREAASALSPPFATLMYPAAIHSTRFQSNLPMSSYRRRDSASSSTFKLAPEDELQEDGRLSPLFSTSFLISIPIPSVLARMIVVVVVVIIPIFLLFVHQHSLPFFLLSPVFTLFTYSSPTLLSPPPILLKKERFKNKSDIITANRLTEG